MDFPFWVHYWLWGGATYAALSDTVMATNNTFASGSADLQISLDGTSYSESIVVPPFDSIIPGETEELSFWLMNNGSEDVNLDVLADVSAISVPDAGNDLDNALLVSWICDLGADGFGNDIASAEFSPRDWLNGGNTSILLNLAVGAEVNCKMMGRLPSTANNTVAGETFAFDVKYDATQVIPTPPPPPPPPPVVP